MNTFQLTCFLTLAETLNFARAAERLHITQPSVTHQIHSLETELGVKLFNRTTRNVEITSAGKSFLVDAAGMVQISENAKKRFRNPDDRRLQTFAVGCHGTPQLEFLAEIFRQMGERYPDIDPKIQTVPMGELYRLLAEERVDVLLAFRETESGKAPGIYKELGKVPIVMICPPEHPLAGKEQVTPEDLKKERLIINEPMRCPENIAKLQGAILEGHTLSDLYFSDTPEVAVTLIKAGFGVTILPESLVPAALGLASVPLAGAEPLSFGVYYKTWKGKPMLKSFIELAKENCRF